MGNAQVQRVGRQTCQYQYKQKKSQTQQKNLYYQQPVPKLEKCLLFGKFCGSVGDES